MSLSIKNRVFEKIKAMPVNEVFTLADFADIAGTNTISKTIDRLLENGDLRIQKIVRGVFWKKSESKKPEAHKLAYALARANKWTVAACGTTATYLMGITSELPKKWTFVTDGTYRDYKIFGYDITFKHTSGKLLVGMSEKTALLVHTIKEYGESHTPEALKNWVDKLSKIEKKTILKESKNVTEWISKKINNLLGN